MDKMEFPIDPFNETTNKDVLCALFSSKNHYYKLR